MSSSLDYKTIPIVFDLDGTLWDSCDSVFKAWNLGLDRWRKSHSCGRGLITHAEIQSIMGKSFDNIFLQLFPEYDYDTRKKLGIYLEEFESEILDVEGGELYSGINSGLNLLSQKHPLGIISNCQAGYIEIFLNNADRFKLVDFKSHGATGLSKAQNIFNMCQEQDFKHMVYLGDTLTDLMACEEVNNTTHVQVDFHLASWGFGYEQIKNQVDPSRTWFSFKSFSESFDS